MTSGSYRYSANSFSSVPSPSEDMIPCPLADIATPIGFGYVPGADTINGDNFFDVTFTAEDGRRYSIEGVSAADVQEACNKSMRGKPVVLQTSAPGVGVYGYAGTARMLVYRARMSPEQHSEYAQAYYANKP